jgi:hypothetical protein
MKTKQIVCKTCGATVEVAYESTPELLSKVDELGWRDIPELDSDGIIIGVLYRCDSCQEVYVRLTGDDSDPWSHIGTLIHSSTL